MVAIIGRRQTPGSDAAAGFHQAATKLPALGVREHSQSKTSRSSVVNGSSSMSSDDEDHVAQPAAQRSASLGTSCDSSDFRGVALPPAGLGTTTGDKSNKKNSRCRRHLSMLAIAPMQTLLTMEGSNSAGNNTIRAPRVGHKKSRKGCAQCKRRHVKCNEESPCSNCVRHGVPCSLAGGPNVPREDARPKAARSPSTSSPSLSRRTSHNEPASRSTATIPPRASTSYTTSTSQGSSPRDDPESNSIRILTGSIDRNPALTGQASMLDLELMHHFMTTWMDIMTEHFDLEGVWQHELPRIGFRHPYVMHGLLGFSALHVASLQPERAPQLRASAVVHLDQALVFYRKDCGPATADNADARFTFTWLVALFAYAIPPSVPPIDAMVEIFSLVKGIETVLHDTMLWVVQGPFAPMLARAFVEGGGYTNEGNPYGASYAFATQISTSRSNDAISVYDLPEGMDFGLNHLDFMIGMHSMLPDERRTCVLILSELKQLYNQVVQSQGQCGMSNLLCFPKQDNTHFSQLLKRRNPQALIVLAYYTVLLDLLDARWWISGWGRSVLTDIVGSLGDEWKSWIDWPVQTVLMKGQHGQADFGADVGIDTAMVL